jgi:hypothetical protein
MTGKTTKSEIVPVEENAGIQAPLDGFGYADGVLDFDALNATGETYSIEGYTLIEDKIELIGVPHMITGVTYQVPKPGQRGFCSVEAVIGNAEMLSQLTALGRIPGKLTVSPGELIVYNDGSTGVRRQLTQQFQQLGMLNVGIPDSEGDKRFDIPWTEWAEFSQSKKQGDGADATEVPYFNKNHVGRQLAIKAFRGLRASEYSNEYSDDAVTFYLG